MLRGIHIDERWPRLSSKLPALAQLRETWPLSLLEQVSISDSLGDHDSNVLLLTFDNLLSVATKITSFHLVTSHASVPSNSLTLDTGSDARSLAYSAGGSRLDARWNGKLGASVVAMVDAVRLMLCCPNADETGEYQRLLGIGGA